MYLLTLGSELSLLVTRRFHFWPSLFYQTGGLTPGFPMHQFVLLPSSHIPSISSVERTGFCSQTLHILIAVSCGFWVGTFLWVVEFAAGWWSQDPAVPNPINKAIDLFLRQMGRVGEVCFFCLGLSACHLSELGRQSSLALFYQGLKG